MRKIELLAPAKNLQCGIAAIDHGADAVYIGADRFGARAAACNSVDDIAALVKYAHVFGAKVYVTVNTIIYDNEIDATLQLLRSLDEVGVDAALVQDMAIVEKMQGKLRMALHASTQTDNRSAEKVAWLRSIGFSRVVLARELSLEEIRTIHEYVPDVELEVFVHGALCVSYSGVCYASEYCFHRSANRGACAQFCRLRFSLDDAVGKHIGEGHFLSLKDMCRIDSLAELLDAGACSFKIEGRLKDVNYVKNVVSAYNKKLNEIIAQNPQKYCRASMGRVEYGFEPNLKKTFNRGYTEYFLHGRRQDIASFDTPKAIGEFVGNVKEIGRNSFSVAGTASFANGDGLCFIDENHQLQGFRVNRAEGNMLYPQRMPNGLRRGMSLYRNSDEAFERVLSGNTATRKMPLRIVLSTTDSGFSLSIQMIECDCSSEIQILAEHQLAQKPQRENIIRQLSKLGNTPFVADDIQILNNADSFFIPSSLLADARRKGVESLLSAMEDKEKIKGRKGEDKETLPNNVQRSMFNVQRSMFNVQRSTSNVSNRFSRAFYERMGFHDLPDAFEVSGFSDYDEPQIMQCRHCIRYSLGHCVRRGGTQPTWHEPLFLRLPDGRRFRLDFDCKHCQMNVYAEKK